MNKENIRNKISQNIYNLLKVFIEKSHSGSGSTTSINLGRRRGHSWIASNIVQNYKNSILIVPHAFEKQYFSDKIQDKIFSARNLPNTRGIANNDSIIVVDSSSAIEDKIKNNIIDNFYNSKSIIFLG